MKTPTRYRKGTRLQKRGAIGGTNKEELVPMIEMKKALVAERKEEKAARLNELKSLGGQEIEVHVGGPREEVEGEEHRLALKEEGLVKEKKVEERALIFMNPTMMDATAKTYWKLTCVKIMIEKEVSHRLQELSKKNYMELNIRGRLKTATL